MAFVRTRASNAAAEGEQETQAPDAPAETLRVKRMNLRGAVWAEVEVVADEAVGGRRVVRVEFPDCARSMLETLHWDSSRSVVDVVARIAVEHVDPRALAAAERNGRGDGPGKVLRFDGGFVLPLPVEAFRSTLEAIRRSPSAEAEGPRSHLEARRDLSSRLL